MVGEDVLRGSLTTGGVSKQMSPKGAICGILGTICTKKTKTKTKPLKTYSNKVFNSLGRTTKSST